MLREGDKASISRACEFGLIDDRCAMQKGLQVFSSHREEYRPPSEQWGLGSSHILSQAPDVVATIFFRKSGDNFTSIPFKEFVRKAFGIQSDCMESFFRKYERLSLKLHYDSVKAPKHCDFLLELKTVSHNHPVQFSFFGHSNNLQSLEEIQSDPFIIATIEYTWQTLFMKQKARRMEPPDTGIEGLTNKLSKILDRVIINPLQQLLGKPSTAPQILEDLEVLKYRFRDYCAASQVDWESPFNTNICFLEHIRWGLPIPALAEAITKQDHTLFSLHITAAFTQNENTSKLERARSPLNRRWSHFSNDIKYCLAARIDVASQVDQLAQVC